MSVVNLCAHSNTIQYNTIGVQSYSLQWLLHQREAVHLWPVTTPPPRCSHLQPTKWQVIPLFPCTPWPLAHWRGPPTRAMHVGGPRQWWSPWWSPAMHVMQGSSGHNVITSVITAGEYYYHTKTAWHCIHYRAKLTIWWPYALHNAGAPLESPGRKRIWWNLKSKIHHKDLGNFKKTIIVKMTCQSSTDNDF